MFLFGLLGIGVGFKQKCQLVAVADFIPHCGPGGVVFGVGVAWVWGVGMFSCS